MLVLARKLNEEIVIGDNIKIRVVGIDRGLVKLGITAPPEIPVHRLEVANRDRSQVAPQQPAS